MARIALVGGGSMGEALLSGLLRAGRQVKDLVVAERMPDRARYLAETYGVLVTSLPDAVDNATFVIIAVKPSDVGPVVGEIGKVAAEADHDSPDQVFITVAAGVTTTYLESKLLAGTPVVCAGADTQLAVGSGFPRRTPPPTHRRHTQQGQRCTDRESIEEDRAQAEEEAEVNEDRHPEDVRQSLN